ncbi:MAG: ABC transporter ATP-binding protein/permease [Proteobacteria bacterium]|nr:ABC transporter ATP-binding protein/permease [Pseudomonadota bacterium]
MTEQTPDPAPPTPAATAAAAVGSAGAPRKSFLKQVLRLAGPYWHGERRKKVRGATLLLLLLTMAQVGLAVWGNYWNRALYDALEQRSVRGVVIQIGVFAVITLTSLGITAAHLMVKRWLQIDWRAWLTEQLVGRWMGEGHHYRLLFTPGEHDNPDQRISEDIRIATESAIGLAHSLTFSLLILGLFINILWTVSGSVDVPGFNINVPGYMVPLAFLYAILGSAVGWVVGLPLIKTTNALQTAEATFRFGLSRAREHTEAIALMRGEPRERAGSTTRFRQIIRDWTKQSLAYMGLVSFGTVYGSLLPVLPILIAAPQYIAGTMTLGALMQAAQAFQQLTSSLSWPVDSIGEIARCRASADRVLSLYEDLEQLDDKTQAAAHPQIELMQTDDARLVVEDLCIAEPSGRVLTEHLSLDIRRGERVLIAGDPALTGSLFKVIGGLWPWGNGRVLLPGDGGMLFLAQRPFLPEGLLRDAICYPLAPDAFPEAEIIRVLEAVGLSRLVQRLGEQDNWEQALPPRAQQQLGFARVLLQKPAWVFLEQATDAFDPEGELAVLEMLIRELPDATLLTISFHPDLGKLHQRTLTLNRCCETKVLFGERRAGNGDAH